ncbi:S-adenosyl-L-methionine-dependent methyltransferase [Fimicolochytrium jonesii]|uniref:S-adenosyl-L-methionine-dependent methyltransferase n=1 Tax=Fimicolochytrium jonesii TaxID=1396493 RepID=UPI0022FE045D|nr:S-adenosyl-L-methionine-dependent methyltransferase [Fimicolochytrium jonesii]KAI8816568.1 S-adenosyl-L-methionine-dependent methyltransferase [Fimicolochytrium jonesii]
MTFVSLPRRKANVVAVLLLGAILVAYIMFHYGSGASTMTNALQRFGVYARPKENAEDSCVWSRLSMPIKAKEVDSSLGRELRVKIMVYENDIIGDIVWNENRLYEDKLQRAYLDAVKTAGLWDRKGLYVDAGANVGVHALVFAKLGFEVHAFEPTKTTREKLLCSGELNELTNLMVYKYAFGAKVDTGSFCMETSPEHGTGNMGGMTVSTVCDNKERIEVTTMDTMWKEKFNRRQIGFLKIDVEGHEPDLIEGGSEMFREMPPTVIATEINVILLRRNNKDPLDYIKSLRQLGYSLFVPIPHRLLPSEEDEAFITQGGGIDGMMDLIGIQNDSL